MGIAPDYVLDRMEMYEAKSLLNYGYYREQESWEQTRLMAYVTAQVNSTKKLKMSDIIKFQWDEKPTENKAKIMDDSELQRLKKKAQSIIDKNILD